MNEIQEQNTVPQNLKYENSKIEFEFPAITYSTSSNFNQDSTTEAH